LAKNNTKKSTNALDASKQEIEALEKRLLVAKHKHEEDLKK